ncbi:hypothetical protein R3P38DRAFT_3212747 [Favolaschia claudopus]|uniref:Uncharacterized protein n=1 Tax=Favolaschia claudopus TaxID=2862362 RepID=A0AAW0ADV3_9AGAR
MNSEPFILLVCKAQSRKSTPSSTRTDPQALQHDDDSAPQKVLRSAKHNHHFTPPCPFVPTHVLFAHETPLVVASATVLFANISPLNYSDLKDPETPARWG